MYNKQPHSGRDAAIVPYNLFTGGDSKVAAFTIYYNIAFENIQKIKKQLNNKTPGEQLAFWAEYLWKAHFLKKNSGGYVPDHKDANIVKLLMQKLEQVRNYHSHIWHDNDVLQFPVVFKEFIEQKHEEAKAALYTQYPEAVHDFEQLAQKSAYQNKSQLFKEVSNGASKNWYITTAGRSFFLSFFLTTGEMNSFLQQRSGYKRTDMPQFKLTRLLYTFYCHRDGAAISHYHQESHIVNQLEKQTREDILKARTAFKLISYLVDFPDYWGNKESMVLANKENKPIKRVAELKAIIEETNLLPGLQFNLVERKHHPIEEDQKIQWQQEKEAEDRFRSGTIAFSCSTIPGYTFQIAFDSLYRLVLLQSLKTAELDPLSNLLLQLEKLAANRQRLYNILITPTGKRKEEEISYLLTKENQYLRGGRKLTERGIIYFEQVEKERDNTKDKADSLLLANYIRNNDTGWLPIPGKRKMPISECEPEPIQVYEHDFIAGEKRKFRAGNRFVFYAARYLVDFAGDNWYWGMEKHDYNEQDSLVKQKAYFQSSAIPANEDYRLTLENDHVYIGIPKHTDAQKNYERFYQFALGANAMRYLAAYIVGNESNYREKIKAFLDTLAGDLALLAEKGAFNINDGYRLLESPYVAGYLQQKDNSLEQLKQQVNNRVGYIIQQWDKALEERQFLSRSDKNQIVMEAYRLFDWAADRADGKFLRADEYNQLSVCHYSLHTKGESKSKGTNFEHLFYNLFELNKRQPPIPKEISALIKDPGIKHLDQLMEAVFENRKKDFRERLPNLLSLPAKHLKKELPVLCRKIGISIPLDLLTAGEQVDLATKHRHTLAVQPFGVHPMLVVKYFFPSAYQETQTTGTAVNKNGQTIQKRPILTLLGDVRQNKQLNSVLNEDFYSTEKLANLYRAAGQTHQMHKLTGLMNTTCTEDILLWRMAQQYLVNNEYTRAIGEVVRQHRSLKIEEMHSIPVVMELKRGKGNDDNNPSDAIPHSLFTTVLMHQLDDMMFIINKDRLRKAAVHFVQRCTGEQELWDDIKAIKANGFNGTPLPDGSREKPIPFQLLRYEIDLVHRTGQKLADHILSFEKNILQQELDLHHHNNKEALQHWLLNHSSKRNPEDKDHFNFAAVLSLLPGVDEQAKSLLSEYRNIAFHDDIPVGATGSFSWLTRKGTAVRKILNIEEDLHTKKDRSAYETGMES